MVQIMRKARVKVELVCLHERQYIALEAISTYRFFSLSLFVLSLRVGCCTREELSLPTNADTSMDMAWRSQLGIDLWSRPKVVTQLS